MLFYFFVTDKPKREETRPEGNYVPLFVTGFVSFIYTCFPLTSRLDTSLTRFRHSFSFSFSLNVHYLRIPMIINKHN